MPIQLSTQDFYDLWAKAEELDDVFSEGRPSKTLSSRGVQIVRDLIEKLEPRPSTKITPAAVDLMAEVMYRNYVGIVYGNDKSWDRLSQSRKDAYSRAMRAALRTAGIEVVE